MAFLGDFGKALGLGNTNEVLAFAANAAASLSTGGAIPIQTSPFEREEPQQMNPFELQSRNVRMQNIQPAVNAGSSSNFFGGLGQSIGDFGRGVGSFVQDISPLTSLFGLGGSQAQTRPQAAQTIIRQAPDESSSSGEILGANLGVVGGLAQLGRGLARSPAAQGLLGGAVGFAGGALVPMGNGMPRITRRMKSDVRRIYMMAGMDPNATAQILNNLGTYPRMNFSTDLVFFILTKRFRNDGPVVTKAAVRKTKTTLRRMKGVVDMYNSVCKPAPRRAAPRKPAAPKALQLIKN